MESKTISDIKSMCSNTCMTPVGHTGDDISYLGTQNLLAFPLEKYMGSLILGSAYILCIQSEVVCNDDSPVKNYFAPVQFLENLSNMYFFL